MEYANRLNNFSKHLKLPYPSKEKLPIKCDVVNNQNNSFKIT